MLHYLNDAKPEKQYGLKPLHGIEKDFSGFAFHNRERCMCRVDSKLP